MADWGDWGSTDWLNWSGETGIPVLASDVAPTIDWSSFTAGGPGSWAGQMTTDFLNGSGSGGSSLLSTLGSLGSGLGKFLGSNASWLGPAASALGSLGTGLLGANASSDAAAAQSAALNRAIDLQTAQWLQQQQNQAPWLEAGRLALGDMTGRAQWAQPTLGQVAPISGANYALPSATPGWTPQTYAGYTPTDVPRAAGYAYTPGQVPSAAWYRYTPGQIPDASQYRYTPGALPTLSGAELLANDPGVQFRLDEGRRALEASAAARGGLTSGATLAALQRQGQELSSQEYANAWNRAAQQAQMREQWGQTASQLGYGQAMSEAQLREQVNQIASQQGWSQAQAETVLREQLAQQAGQQNWQQAMQEANARAQQAQFGWQSGFQAQQAGQQEARQYETDLYNRLLQQSQTQYGRDWAAREAENQRLMDAYNALRQGQTTAWNQFASLAGLGQTAVGQLGTTGQANATQMGSLLGQLGNAQAGGALGGGQAWISGIGSLNNAIQGSLGNAQFQNQLSSLLATLNR